MLFLKSCPKRSEALKSVITFLINNRLLIFLLIINFILLISHIFWGENNAFFNLDKEKNLPTVWASLQALLAAGLWWRWHQSVKNDKIKKVTFAIFKFTGFFLLFYIAMDEFFQWHEFFGDQLGLYLQSIAKGEIFWRYNPVFAWLLIFTPIILILGIFFVYVAWSLWPYQVFWKVCGVASLFVLGAYGIEFLGCLSFNEVWQKIPYWYLITIEESLELFSMALLAVIFYKQSQIIKLK